MIDRRTLRICSVLLSAALPLLFACKKTVDPMSTPTAAPPMEPHAVLDRYDLPAAFGAAQYSADEIQVMIDADLSLEEAAAHINTVPDLIQYLYMRGFHPSDRMDLQFTYGDLNWSVNRSAETVFSENEGNCGGCANLVNTLLCGDYDATGHIYEARNSGGHIFNYFEQDGQFLPFDLLAVMQGSFGGWLGGTIEGYAAPADFAAAYVEENHNRYADPSGNRLVLLIGYPYQGQHPPMGFSWEYRTASNLPYVHFLSQEIEGEVTILHLAEGYEPPNYLPAPPKSDWPMEAR